MKLFSAVVCIFVLFPGNADVTTHFGHSLDCSVCACTVLPNNQTQADCSCRSLDSLVNATLPENTSILLLQSNHLARIGFVDFQRLPILKELDLSHNNLRQIDNDTFSSSSHLEYLNLQHNAVNESCYTRTLLKNQLKLKTLKLNGNNITTFPSQLLESLKSLKTLYIDGVPDIQFPRLFQLENLTMSGFYGRCKIQSLSSETFQYLRSLKYLDVTKCHIKSIDEDTFSNLTSLMHLDISINPQLGLGGFGRGSYGLRFTNISTLAVNNIVPTLNSCVVIKEWHVSHLSNTSLISLYINNNAVENIGPGVLGLLPKSLQFISAEKNRFRYGPYLKELTQLAGLKGIQLSGVPYPMTFPGFDQMLDPDDECEIEENDFYDFESDDRAGYSYPPHVGGQYPVIMHLSLPPKLKLIKMNFTQQVFKMGNIHFFNNSVEHLDLSSNLLQFEEGSIVGLDNLTYLDLSNNLARNISLDLFKDCTALETLNISYNFFGWKITSDTRGRLFENLVNLKELVLSYNDLNVLPPLSLIQLASLRKLDVSYNGLYDFRPILNASFNLQTIDLSNNQIKWMNSRVMKELNAIKLKSPNFTLILKLNPLLCRCSNLDTLEWLLTSGVTPDNMSDYYCLLITKQKRRIADKDDFRQLITELKAACINNFGLALGCLSVVLVAFGLMAGSIMYRYRWKLRYLYYAARLRYMADTIQEDAEDEFLFDAFVSYADEDRSFVINDMRAHLEHEHNMTLNIHHRDFLPGEPIASNIIGAIRRSRKTLVLMTQNFLNSYWCMYELRMAQMESISTGRNVIIVIMYESVPARNIPPEFLHLLETDSYIEYPHEEMHDLVFWQHLVRAMRHRSMRQGSVISQ